MPVISTKFSVHFPTDSISTLGRIKDISHSRLLRPSVDSSGYYLIRVNYNLDTRTLRLHKVMANFFLPDDYSETEDLLTTLITTEEAAIS